QQRLWAIDKFEGGSAHYNMSFALRVAGSFNVDKAEAAFIALLERHEILRTVYGSEEGVAYQRVLAELDWAISRRDISALANAAQEQAIQEAVDAEAAKAFDLSQDVMLRVSWLQCDAANGAGVLLLTIHHIASDGWSMNVLVNEFSTLYESLVAGQQESLPALPCQYLDYSLWQRNKLQGETLASLKNYWKNQLLGAPALHQLPLDFPRPAMPSHQGAVVSATLPAEVVTQLKRLAKQHDMTPFMVIHTVLSVVLSRYGQSSDVVVGTPVAGRLHESLEGLIGFFVNTLVLRVDCAQADNIEGLLSHVKQVNLDAHAHQELPFEEVVELLNVPRTIALTPLFQIMLT
ncbi:condensation domain-containing protein, partial [Pseudoalteromonas ulvae]|uniref:condensation domain-containing protein n=1 Tax=Pseudoalteromonas ulvae TaxID=107327 RepID=UPI001D04DDAF